MPEESSTSQEEAHGGERATEVKRPSTKEKLLQEITQKIEESKGLQEESINLHQRADEVAENDPKLAEDLRFKAREIDKRAAKLLKTARRLESGWMQGGAAGAGIGAGIATGLGMTVGSLISGLVAIPTTGLGILIGAGTGIVHGPWVKFTEVFTKDEVSEIDREAEEEAKRIEESG
ncbi:hypothetical protein GQX73_g8224 [Xylaria multiplex]|uniref:Uncharacterized protein n=1 Tax=Xylaria multiplex TaxID=323545 RepID=A0A7C8IJN8_9PEZI|nr:hypothetical protein GQX73_g8224 [Xylaria multiplex]